MIEVGKTDAFERRYMQEFRRLAGEFGEFVGYERDRGARDIGLHLTRKLASGKEKLTSALCWFQMKGIMAKTLSAKAFEKRTEIKISLDVLHLKYWFLQPMPTYLALYVESADKFLVLNLPEYIEKRWGQKILDLKQKEITVAVPKDSELDDEAFHHILKKSSVKEWKKALSADEEAVRFCVRDYGLIWHLGTAQARKVRHRLVFWDWQSKMRSQLFIGESPLSKDKWKTLREHWQYAMQNEELEPSYPYLEFSAENPGWDDDESYVPPFPLKNGDAAIGKDYMGEYFQYIFTVELNDLGQKLFEHVKALKKIGLIEISRKGEWVSVAPWHSRAV